MYFPPYFHGRLQTRLSYWGSVQSATMLLPFARNRVGLAIGYGDMSFDLSSEDAINWTVTLDVAGTIDPVTGVVAETVTGDIIGGIALDLSGNFRGLYVSNTEANVNAPVNCWMVTYSCPLKLNWIEHGSAVNEQWWALDAYGAIFNVCVYETVLIEGSLEEYTQLCRQNPYH